MRRTLVACFALAASFAGAESNTLTGTPGFFKPTPDGNSSISRVVPLEEAQRPPAQPLPARAVSPVQVATVVPAPEVPLEARAQAEEPVMDRAEREQREIKARATNERDR